MPETLPINDSFLMQEFKSGHYFCGVKSCAVLVETTTLLNVEHKVSAVQVFHYKKQVRLQKKTNKHQLSFVPLWSYLPRFGTYKTNGKDMDALFPTLGLYVRSSCIRRRRPQAPHLSSGILLRSMSRNPSARQALPKKGITMICDQ